MQVCYESDIPAAETFGAFVPEQLHDLHVQPAVSGPTDPHDRQMFTCYDGVCYEAPFEYRACTSQALAGH